MDRADLLEREFVRLVAALAAERGLSYAQFAKQAFNEDLCPEVKWRQIRNTSKGGKPQRLSLADAMRCADALDLYFPALCFRAVETLRMADELHADICGAQKKAAG